MNSESAPRSTSTNYLAVTQASLEQHPGKSDVNSRVVFACANISSISGSQFQIFNGPVNMSFKNRTILEWVDLLSKVMT